MSAALQRLGRAAPWLCALIMVVAGFLGRPLAPHEASLYHSATAPSGRYQLRIRAGVDRSNGPYQRFEIYRAGKPPVKLFAAPERFRTRDRTHFVWDRDGRIWVYSGDVGTFYWEHLTDTNWKKIRAEDHPNLRPPAPINERLPWRLQPTTTGKRSRS